MLGMKRKNGKMGEGATTCDHLPPILTASPLSTAAIFLPLSAGLALYPFQQGLALCSLCWLRWLRARMERPSSAAPSALSVLSVRGGDRLVPRRLLPSAVGVQPCQLGHGAADVGHRARRHDPLRRRACVRFGDASEHLLGPLQPRGQPAGQSSALAISKAGEGLNLVVQDPLNAPQRQALDLRDG